MSELITALLSTNSNLVNRFSATLIFHFPPPIFNKLFIRLGEFSN